MERLIELTKRHKLIMENKNIIILVYVNSSGFLWSLQKLNSGTNLGWSGWNGNCKYARSFKTYEDALEDALDLIDKCDLEQFRKDVTEGFYWAAYAFHLNKNYRDDNSPKNK